MSGVVEEDTTAGGVKLSFSQSWALAHASTGSISQGNVSTYHLATVNAIPSFEQTKLLPPPSSIPFPLSRVSKSPGTSITPQGIVASSYQPPCRHPPRQLPVHSHLFHYVSPSTSHRVNPSFSTRSSHSNLTQAGRGGLCKDTATAIKQEVRRIEHLRGDFWPQPIHSQQPQHVAFIP